LPILKTSLMLALCFSIFLNLLLVTNLFEFIPEYSIYNTTPLVDRNAEISWISYVENAQNYTYFIEENVLKMSLVSRYNTDNRSLYSINVKSNLPLQPSLNISFVMCANLTVTSDGGFITLSLFDGKEVIEISYYIGQSKPEYEKEGYYYVGYQIGNISNTWFKCLRNIRMDLITKNLPSERPWKIIEVGVGILSNSTEQSANKGLDVSLNLTDSFFKGEINYVNVNLSSIHLTIEILACIIAVTFISYFTYISLRKKLKNNKIIDA